MDPWFHGQNWRIGPLTLNEEERRAAEQRWRQIQQGGAPSMEPDRQRALEEFTAGPQRPQAAPPATPPAQEGGQPSGIAGLLRKFNRAASMMLPSMPVQLAEDWVENGPPWSRETQPRVAPSTPGGEIALPDSAPIPSSPPPVMAEAPVQAPQQDQDAAMLAEMERYRKMWERFAPQMDRSQTPQQQAAQNFNAGALDRTALLARLALASGITAGAGGPWKDIGMGFGAAAEVYDEGFKRYQNTLNDAAEQEMNRREKMHQEELGRAELAYKMYADQAKAAREAAQKHADNRREIMTEYLKEGGPDPLVDPEGAERHRELWALEAGILDLRD